MKQKPLPNSNYSELLLPLCDELWQLELPSLTLRRLSPGSSPDIPSARQRHTPCQPEEEPLQRVASQPWVASLPSADSLRWEDYLTLVHPEDRQELCRLIELLSGEGKPMLRPDSPASAEELPARHVEYRLREEGKASYRWVTARILPLGNQQLLLCLFSLEQRQWSDSQTLAQLRQLRYQAEQDPLSGLLNKAAAEQAISFYLGQVPRRDDCALLLLDLDDFKQVNDTLGHLCGDELLRQVGRLLREEFRERDILGRIGGDEFIILTKHLSQPVAALAQARRLLAKLRQLRLSDGRPLSGSCGLSLIPTDSIADRSGRESYLARLREADQALYAAKSLGKGQALLYQPGLGAAKTTPPSAPVGSYSERE